MQRRAEADDRPEHVGQRRHVIAVVQVPALAVVVGQPGVRGGGGELCVQQQRPRVGIGLVDDREPVVNDRSDFRMVLGRGRECLRHPEGEGALLDAGAILGPVVRQRRGQQDRILAVRVEMHKTITSRWTHDLAEHSPDPPPPTGDRDP